MRQIGISEELYKWFSKVLEDENIQFEIRKFETSRNEELTKIYDVFHKQKKKR